MTLFHTKATLFCSTIVLITLLAGKGLTEEDKTITIAKLDAPVSQYRIMAAKVLEAAYSKLGYRVKILSGSGRGAINWANSGYTDALFARIEGLEKQFTNLIKIDIPIAHDKISLYTKGRSLMFKGRSDLKNLRIAYIRGFKKAEYYTRNMDVTQTDTTEKSFELLRKGRVDVVIALTSIAAQVRHESNCEIEPISPHIDEIQMYHYLNSAHTDLAEKLNDVLRKMASTGELSTIQQRAMNSLNVHNQSFTLQHSCQ